VIGFAADAECRRRGASLPADQEMHLRRLLVGLLCQAAKLVRRAA